MALYLVSLDLLLASKMTTLAQDWTDLGSKVHAPFCSTFAAPTIGASLEESRIKLVRF